MKDAVTGDTPRTGGSNHRPGDFRMGQPVQSNVCTLCTESIGAEELTRGTEISKYPEEKKIIVPIYRDSISSVATSEMETA
jgi:hypothetical protein